MGGSQVRIFEGTRVFIAAALATTPCGCMLNPAPIDATRGDGIRYAFVVLGEEGKPIARAITDAAA